MARPHRLTDRARQLRRNLTPAEKILWPVLRNRAFGGLKFRRQQEIGPYIVDFFCAAVRVVVELDGESHVGTEVKDERRHEWLEGQGIKVLRFWNHEVYENLKEVLETI